MRKPQYAGGKGEFPAFVCVYFVGFLTRDAVENPSVGSFVVLGLTALGAALVWYAWAANRGWK